MVGRLCRTASSVRPRRRRKSRLVAPSRGRLPITRTYRSHRRRKPVDIRARVSGYLIKVNFKDGDIVKPTILLYQIDPRPFQADLDPAKGMVEQFEATKKLMDIQVDRYTQAGRQVGRQPAGRRPIRGPAGREHRRAEVRPGTGGTRPVEPRISPGSRRPLPARSAARS